MEKRVAIVTHVCELAGLATAQALARDGMTVVCHDATFGDGTIMRSSPLLGTSMPPLRK